jgi:glycosyltransferase involved in cell wall biosynthesis
MDSSGMKKKVVPVSVVIPNYNRASLVKETIVCILNQTVAPLEIIVVDDGSTDDSLSVLSGFGDQLTVISQVNQGPGPARNAGLKVAKGEFIWFMDSDDLASLNKIEVQYNALVQSGADFAYCPWAACTISNNLLSFKGRVLQDSALPPHKPMLEWFLSGWSLVFQNCMFRRSVLDKAGEYRSDLMPSEDSEYFIRILMTEARPIHTPDCLILYREHNVNKITATGTSNVHRLKDWTRFLDISGRQLSTQLSDMRTATKIALVSLLNKHLSACAAAGLPLLADDHPYMILRKKIPELIATAYDLYNRFRRKMKGHPDFLAAFKARPIRNADLQLVRELGYAVQE